MLQNCELLSHYVFRVGSAFSINELNDHPKDVEATLVTDSASGRERED